MASESIAIIASLFLCGSGGLISTAEKCSDGTNPQKTEIYILSPSDIISISKNNEIMFRLDHKGTITSQAGFSVDEAARTFWTTVTAALPNACDWLQDNKR